MIKIYKDNAANAIFIEDANGGQFVNSLTASFVGNMVTVTDTSRSIEIISSVLFSEFVDKDGNPYGGNVSDVVNELEEIFTSNNPPSMDVFFAELDSSFTSTTSWQDVNLSAATRSDDGYIHSSGSAEITLSPGDYELHYGVIGDQSTSNNRVESQIRLLLDGVEYGFDANYSQRNNAIDMGGVNSFYLLTGVTDGQILKLQTQHVGSSNTIVSAKIFIRKVY